MPGQYLAGQVEVLAEELNALISEEPVESKHSICHSHAPRYNVNTKKTSKTIVLATDKNLSL
eukprot:scaffold180755_cov22-Prasinocladus_malaysianus.AAC.1